MGKDDNQREILMYGEWGENKVVMHSWAGTPPLKRSDSQIMYDTMYGLTDENFIALLASKGFICFQDDKFVSQWRIAVSRLTTSFPHLEEV